MTFLSRPVIRRAIEWSRRDARVGIDPRSHRRSLTKERPGSRQRGFCPPVAVLPFNVSRRFKAISASQMTFGLDCRYACLSPRVLDPVTTLLPVATR